MNVKGPGVNRRRVTSVDVARAAGVSQSVVSRAFSANPSVADKTRQRIFAVAADLGYRQNLIARSLITRQSRIFALVTGALTNPLHLSLIEAFTRIAQHNGYRVLLFSTGPDKTLDQSIVEVLQYRPDGIAALAGPPSDELIQECRRDGIPIVLLGREAAGSSASAVSCDNQAEAERVAGLLLGGGHERFAFVTSRNPAMSFSLDRERGFTNAVRAAGREAPAIENGDSSYGGGYKAGLRLLGRGERPDAVFCASDTMAFGVLDAARREYGLRIPEDLSVFGFDDVPMAAWASYELSTIRQRVEIMVEATTEILLDPSTLERTAPLVRHVPGDLIVRKSARLAKLDDPRGT